MRDTNRGMNISEQEYMAAVDDILDTLDKHKIDDQTRKDVLAIVYSGRDHSRLNFGCVQKQRCEIHCLSPDAWPARIAVLCVHTRVS
jgi:hypothetical protein